MKIKEAIERLTSITTRVDDIILELENVAGSMVILGLRMHTNNAVGALIVVSEYLRALADKIRAMKKRGARVV